MNLFDYITTFTKVVETGSFTKAGDALDISAAAVSKQINQLEASLGVSLLVRSTRRISITEAGNIIYNKSQQILNNVNELKNYSDSLRLVPAGELNIAASMTVGHNLVLPLISEFIKLYPKIGINFSFVDIFPDFNQTPIDIFVASPLHRIAEQKVDVVAAEMFEMNRILIASPKYVKKYGQPKSLKEMKNFEYIIHRNRLDDPMIDLQKQGEFKLTTNLTVSQGSTLIEAAINGLGIALVPDFIVSHHIKAKKLVQILPNYKDGPTKTYMLYRKLMYPSPNVLAFKNFILEKLRKQKD